MRWPQANHDHKKSFFFSFDSRESNPSKTLILGVIQKICDILTPLVVMLHHSLMRNPHREYDVGAGAVTPLSLKPIKSTHIRKIELCILMFGNTLPDNSIEKISHYCFYCRGNTCWLRNGCYSIPHTPGNILSHFLLPCCSKLI